MYLKFILLPLFFFVLFFKNSHAQNIIFKDDFNGNNSVAGLQARGWVVIDNDGGGTSPGAWFQGNPTVFKAFEGPDSGYVASNFAGANTSGLIDEWLITPVLSVSQGDTLTFWARSAQNTGFNDSIFVFVSPTGSTSLSSYQFVFSAKLDINNWQSYFVAFNSSLSARIAVRYFVLNGNTKGDYIGLDLFQLKSKGSIVITPTVTTSSATNITENSAVLNGIVNPNNSSTNVIFEYGLNTAYGNQISAVQSPVTGTTDVNVTATVTSLQPNTVYHFRVQAIGGGNTVNGSDATFTSGNNYPASIALNNTFKFNDLSSSSYRMIGLPGDQVTKVSDMISGTQKKDWDAFNDNGAASNFLQEFDGTSTFNFTPGKGFWILSKNQFNVNATVNTVTLSADNTFSVALHSGFNIISTPFEKSASWSDIQNLNGLTTNDILFDWSGVWTHAAQMDPYKGYYFKNTNNLTSLKIPYNFAAAKITAANSQEAETYSGNYIKLSLLQNDQVKSFIVTGFNSSAKKDYDKFDCFAPPGYFDEVRIHIEDQNISDPYKQLSVDYRSAINEGQSYDLKVKNDTKKTIRLLAEGTDKFTNDEVYLFDENLNTFYNLKEKNEIDISPIHKNYNYRLLIGNENYINDIKKEYVPVEYQLYQNYPNPFNPSTVIKYQVAGSNTFVELKVYNVLGKEVKTLVNEIQDSGIHEVEFNAADFSSGVYFYTLKALPSDRQSENFSSTKKMILIK